MSGPPQPVYLSRRDKFEGAVLGAIATVVAFQFSTLAGRIFLGGTVYLLFSAVVHGGERIQ